MVFVFSLIEEWYLRAQQTSHLTDSSLQIPPFVPFFITDLLNFLNLVLQLHPSSFQDPHVQSPKQIYRFIC